MVVVRKDSSRSQTSTKLYCRQCKTRTPQNHQGKWQARPRVHQIEVWHEDVSGSVQEGGEDGACSKTMA